VITARSPRVDEEISLKVGLADTVVLAERGNAPGYFIGGVLAVPVPHLQPRGRFAQRDRELVETGANTSTLDMRPLP
jgi:hypothetical protein